MFCKIWYIDVMHGKREISWYLVCVQNFGILTEFWQFYLCNLYLCAGMVEILHLQLRYVWLSKLHVLATGRLYRATFLSNSTFCLCLHKVLLSELKGAELRVLWTHVLACRTDRQCLCDPALCEETQKPQCSGQDLKMSLVPRFSFSYQVSGVWYIHNSRLKGKWLRSVLLVCLYFSKFR